MELYVELIEKDIKNRNNIVTISTLNAKTTPHERYISHYRFGEEFKVFVEKTKSVSDYNGAVSIDNIWVDFDKEGDIDGARKETVKFVKSLQSITGLGTEAFPVFFSGNKGFHVGISAMLVGIQDEFTSDLPDKVKKFIEFITKDIEFVDYSIYNKNRVIRMPYSLNKKSGLYKIYVPYDMLWGEPVSKITGHAKVCDRLPMPKRTIVANAKLIEKYNEANATEARKVIRDGKATSLFMIPESGNRNNVLFKQACKLFSLDDLRTNEANDLMQIIYNETKAVNSGKMISRREFNMLLNSAFKTTKGDRKSGIEVKPVDTLTHLVIDEIRNSQFIPTLIPQWDEDLDGGLIRGNVYSFIGKGGTKKSLLAMWIGLSNCMTSGLPVAYFNMEMSTSQSWTRAVRMLFNRDIKTEVQDGTITDDEIAELDIEFNKAVKNKFYLVDDNNLNPKDMSGVLDDINEKYDDKVGLVVADSMNSMATIGGSEAFTAFEITKELKQLAKDKNCVVILINHVTKGPSKHVRDVSPYVRGGEKVIDNCDAYFCLSQVVDQEKSTLIGEDKDFIYRRDIIYSRLVNKRESGNTIDVVMQLGTDLVPRYIDANPKSCEVSFRE